MCIVSLLNRRLTPNVVGELSAGHGGGRPGIATF